MAQSLIEQTPAGWNRHHSSGSMEAVREGFLEEMTREPCLMMRALQSVMGTGKGTPGRGNSMSKDSEAELSNGERRAMGRQRGLTVLGM